MKNIMNEAVKNFIEKVQEIGMELYEEYSNMDNSGIEYTCPLTDVIDTLYEFSIKDINETIKEN